jgi:acyl-CoA thioester hydrolase
MSPANNHCGKIDMREPFSFELSPRYYETDGLGHINNVSLSGWFETARIRALESLGAGMGLMNWVLASIKIDFQGETFYGSNVVATVTGMRPGNTSLTIDCQMTQDGRNTAFGRAIMVHLGGEGGSPAPIPDELRAVLAEYPSAPE